jgi:hypothetical protein
MIALYNAARSDDEGREHARFRQWMSPNLLADRYVEQFSGGFDGVDFSATAKGRM